MPNDTTGNSGPLDILQGIMQKFGMSAGPSGTGVAQPPSNALMSPPQGPAGMGLNTGAAQQGFANTYNQQATDPYMNIHQDSWLGRNHPQVAGVLDRMMTTMALTNPGRTTGENIQHVAQALMGTPQAELQHRMGLAMLPHQMEAEQAKIGLTQSEIQKNQAESEYYSTRNQAQITSRIYGAMGAAQTRAALAAEAARTDYGPGPGTGPPDPTTGQPSPAYGFWQKKLVEHPDNPDGTPGTPSIEKNFVPLGPLSQFTGAPGAQKNSPRENLFLSMSDGTALQEVNASRSKLGQPPMTQSQLDSKYTGWVTNPRNAEAAFSNGLPPHIQQTLTDITQAGKTYLNEATKQFTSPEAIKAERQDLISQGVDPLKSLKIATSNLQAKKDAITNKYEAWQKEQADLARSGHANFKTFHEYLTGPQPTQQAAPTGGLPPIGDLK
jgi:hypothetical protein